MNPILLEDQHVWSRLIRFEDTNGQERYGEPIDDYLDVGIALHRGEDIYAKIVRAESALDLSAVLSEDIVQVKSVSSGKTYNCWT